MFYHSCEDIRLKQCMKYMTHTVKHKKYTHYIPHFVSSLGLCHQILITPVSVKITVALSVTGSETVPDRGDRFPYHSLMEFSSAPALRSLNTSVNILLMSALWQSFNICLSERCACRSAMTVMI